MGHSGQIANRGVGFCEVANRGGFGIPMLQLHLFPGTFNHLGTHCELARCTRAASASGNSTTSPRDLQGNTCLLQTLLPEETQGRWKVLNEQW